MSVRVEKDWALAFALSLFETLFFLCVLFVLQIAMAEEICFFNKVPITHSLFFSSQLLSLPYLLTKKKKKIVPLLFKFDFLFELKEWAFFFFFGFWEILLFWFLGMEHWWSWREWCSFSLSLSLYFVLLLFLLFFIFHLNLS